MKDLKSMPYTNYAFVLGYGLVGAIDETPAMAAYLSNGTWTSYYFAKTVTVRDGSFSEVLKRDELVARYLTDPETGLMTMHTKTLVNFELNDSGEIKTISFPSINATGKNDKGRLTLDRKYNQPGGDNIPELNETFTYDATLKCIDDAFLTDETIIFDVTLEEDETLDTVSRIQDRINILSVSQLRDGSAPIISLFDMGDGNECAAAITINAAREIDAAEHLFIVNNTTQMLDEYGDEVTAVYGYENGEEKQLILDYDIKVRNLLTDKEETLGSGDLILYTQNASGRVTDAHIIINVGIAKNYLPDVYGDGSLLLPKVNFYTDSANPRRVVKYYFGLVTEKYISQPYGKLVLAKDNTVFPSTLLDRREFSAIVATDDNTAFYRIDQDARKAISESGMADCIVSPSGNFVKRNGDLALVKTVNGIATDVFFITPELQ